MNFRSRYYILYNFNSLSRKLILEIFLPILGQSYNNITFIHYFPYCISMLLIKNSESTSMHMPNYLFMKEFSNINKDSFSPKTCTNRTLYMHYFYFRME